MGGVGPSQLGGLGESRKFPQWGLLPFTVFPIGVTVNYCGDNSWLNVQLWPWQKMRVSGYYMVIKKLHKIIHCLIDPGHAILIWFTYLFLVYSVYFLSYVHV